MLTNVEDLIQSVGNILNLVVPIVITVALIVFFWGLIKYISSSDSDDGRKIAVRRMVGGVVAFFVIVSLWGLVRFLQNSLGITNNSNAQVPGFIKPNLPTY